ncbi:hypothetical protein ACGFR6_11450 [Streptomyces sp. NPDC048567]|uniref:hypothetical protein n=1 Tax=unclassified Streptomyces TaxID=2593676 RepID=UPI002E811E4C|nr:hypothetical protein [Streptomyces sp. NBC_00523]WUD00898.1 hypothetical protein OHS17_15160 [Streptomyces sp. NBC_00523]
MIPPAAIFAGLAVGGGLALLIRELVGPQPDLAASLRRLNATAPEADQETGPVSRDDAWGAWLLEHLQGLPGVTIPRKDLALVGQTPERFLLLKAALAGGGLLIPPFVVGAWTLMGLGVPFYLPVVVGLVLGVLLWFIPDLSVRDQAARAREEFSHAIAAYLDLVALKRAADSGPTEALERAAAVGRGWAFTRLQEAMMRARVDKVPPWEALVQLTQELDLPVLEDVAEIMRMSAHDGAAVYTTLRARSKSLRTELLAKQAAEANENSEKMTAPGALLAVLVMLMVAFPAVINIMAT